MHGHFIPGCWRVVRAEPAAPGLSAAQPIRCAQGCVRQATYPAYCRPMMQTSHMRVGRRFAGLIVGAVPCLLAGFLAAPAGASTQTYPLFSARPPTAPPACTSPTAIAPVPSSQVPALEDSVEKAVGGHLQGIGQCGNGLVLLTLTPGSEVLAQSVRSKFGPSVQIMVGLTVWDGHAGQSPLCGVLPSSSAPTGFSSTLRLKTDRVHAGSDLEGIVSFHDTSAESLRLDTNSPVTVVLTPPKSRQVVGVFAGGVAGTGWTPLLDPGQSMAVSIVGGTARCDGKSGSALPPGRYDAVGEVSSSGVTGPSAPGSPSFSVVLTNDVPIDVVAVDS
jgi:hypothetical protein